MLHHHDLPDRRYDCYVIGAGPAGLTLALELAKTNHSVLVFETGGLTEPRSDLPNAVNYGHFRDGWWNAHSIRILGGTSRVWSGWCATLMDVDFANPAAGVRWPIARSDLALYYRRAARVLDREPSILDVETPLAPGFAYRPFSTGSPTRFGPKYQDALSVSSLVDVALGTSVVGLDANASRSAVSQLTCFRHDAGVRETVHLDAAQNVVLAGGGIGNAHLFPAASCGRRDAGRKRERTDRQVSDGAPASLLGGRGGARRRPRSAVTAGGLWRRCTRAGPGRSADAAAWTTGL